jgi:hypothetical protein
MKYVESHYALPEDLTLTCDSCQCIDTEDNPVVIGDNGEWICHQCLMDIGFFNG